jgi:phage terminase small subunit
MPEGLTDKQIRFVEAMLVEPNQTKAYKAAGYSGEGNTAEVNASRLLKNAKVATELARRRAERAERTNVTADRVVRELAKLGFSDLKRVASWDNSGVKWIPSDELPEEESATLKDVSFTRERRYEKGGGVVETTNTKLTMHDKRGALELLGRHLGLFKDNVNVTHDRPFVVQVQGLRGPETHDE